MFGGQLGQGALGSKKCPLSPDDKLCTLVAKLCTLVDNVVFSESESEVLRFNAI